LAISEGLLQPRLLQNAIRHVARLELAVDGDRHAGLGIPPNLVIAAAGAFERNPYSRNTFTTSR
jgi:hypothetical protein